MDCDCTCDSSDFPVEPSHETGPSRRTVLGAIAAAAVVTPILARSVHADEEEKPGPQTPGGWIKTVKPTDVPDKGAKVVLGTNSQAVTVLTRDGNNIQAFSSICTHKACRVNIAPNNPASLRCKCHGAEFDFTGKNTRGPGKGNPPANL